jgi:hypothetical protein
MQLHRLYPHSLSERQLRIALLSAGHLLQRGEPMGSILSLLQSEQLECCGRPDGPARYRLIDRPWDGSVPFLHPEILEVPPHGCG